MAESFRRSAEMSTGSSDQKGLGELLPSVFGGTTTYVTTCETCGNASTRSENFMELSVPIVEQTSNTTTETEQVPDKKKKKNDSAKTHKKKGGKGITPPPDVDVQHCVNSYLYPESLDGDNQYECSQCNKKVNATRAIILSKLPPVLNLQLARYVFDRETLSKRKLTTKVLLPKSLKIPSAATREHGESRYILCAVQNHLGTSAHGGHYVADVMDWTTGVWYEFNDAEVTVLEGGPVSSFEPSEGTSGNGRKVGGSQDAYNLFYVEESYLASQAEIELRSFAESDASDVTTAGNDILASIKVQRTERYRAEKE